MNKPTGRYKCLSCGAEWDGNQLVLDPLSTATRWTCGFAVCGGSVRLIKEVAQPQQETAATGSWNWQQIGLPKRPQKERYGIKGDGKK